MHVIHRLNVRRRLKLELIFYGHFDPQATRVSMLAALARSGFASMRQATASAPMFNDDKGCELLSQA